MRTARQAVSLLHGDHFPVEEPLTGGPAEAEPVPTDGYPHVLVDWWSERVGRRDDNGRITEATRA